MPKYKVAGIKKIWVVEAESEREARHLAMVYTWGDVSDHVVPRRRRVDGTLEPYAGLGLTVIELKEPKDHA